MQYQCGHQQGFQWARSFAGADALAHLAGLRDEATDEEWGDFFTVDRLANLHPSEWLMMQLLGTWTDADSWLVRREASENWADRSCKPAFVRGFAEGAIARWDEVRGEL